MKNKETRTIKVGELRVKRTEGAPMIHGYAALFNVDSEDLGGFTESIEPGAFKESLKSSDARALFNHDSNFVLGRQSAGTLRLKEDDKGLYMEIDPPDTQFARDLMVSIERGDIGEQSFAFSVFSDKWTEEKKGDSYRVHRRITSVRELFDVSPVTYPAYKDTTVALRSLGDYRASTSDQSESIAAAENDDIEIELLTNRQGVMS